MPPQTANHARHANGAPASPTLNNAPFAGAQAVLQTYAQQMLDSIQKDGFYVRVPSGKQFYLYVLQTIDAADASLGRAATTTGEIPTADEAKSAPTGATSTFNRAMPTADEGGSAFGESRCDNG